MVASDSELDAFRKRFQNLVARMQSGLITLNQVRNEALDIVADSLPDGDSISLEEKIEVDSAPGVME